MPGPLHAKDKSSNNPITPRHVRIVFNKDKALRCCCLAALEDPIDTMMVDLDCFVLWRKNNRFVAKEQKCDAVMTVKQ